MFLVADVETCPIIHGDEHTSMNHENALRMFPMNSKGICLRKRGAPLVNGQKKERNESTQTLFMTNHVATRSVVTRKSSCDSAILIQSSNLPSIASSLEGMTTNAEQDLNSLIVDTLSVYPTDGTFEYSWAQTPSKPTNSCGVPNSPLPPPSSILPGTGIVSSGGKDQILQFDLAHSIFERPSVERFLSENTPLSKQLVDVINAPNDEDTKTFFTSFEMVEQVLAEHDGLADDFLISLPRHDHCLCKRSESLPFCVCGFNSYGIAKDLIISHGNTSQLFLPCLMSTLKGRKLVAEKKREIHEAIKKQRTVFSHVFLSVQSSSPVSQDIPKFSIPCTFCCGVTLEVFFKVFLKHTKFAQYASIDSMLALKRDWFCEKHANHTPGDETFKQGCMNALISRGLGIKINSIYEARKGDFIQFWRTNGTGHSVIFLGLCDDNERFEYWSSQRSTNGIGVNRETISGVTHFYIVRLLK